MVHAFVGVGQCGCQVLDEIFSVKAMFRYATNVLAIDSTQRTLYNLKNIPKKNRAGITRSGKIVSAETEEFAKYVSDGRGGEAKTAVEVIENRFDDFADSFIQVLVPDGKTNPSTVVFTCSLGSGTGGGYTHYCAKAVKNRLNSHVIVVGVLPANKEGIRRARSAVWSINQMRQYSEGFIFVDNEKISHYGNMQSKYKDYNAYVASTLRELMVGHQIRSVSTKGFERKQIDAMDVIIASSSRDGKTVFSAISQVGVLSSSFVGYILPKFLPLGYKKFDDEDISRLADRCFQSLTLNKVNEESVIDCVIILTYPKYYEKHSDDIVDSPLYHRFKDRQLQIGHSLTDGREVLLTMLSTFESNTIQRLAELAEIARSQKEPVV